MTGHSMGGDREQAWRAVITPHVGATGGLLRALHALQASDGFVDPAAYATLADCFNLSRAEIKGVVSFYDDFRDEPPPLHELRICRAEACQAVGSAELVALASTLPDGDDNVRERPVYCLGLCACGPAVMVDGQLHGRVTPERLSQLLEALDD